MTNELSVVQGGQITLYPPDYNDNAVSSGLWFDIRAVQEPHPDVGMPTEFKLGGIREARRILVELDRLCEPAGPAFVTAWIRPLLEGITPGQPTSDDQVTARFGLIVLALQDAAVGAFTRARQVEIARSQRFAPTAADLYEAVGPRSHELRRRQETLRYIANARVEQPPMTIQPLGVVTTLRTPTVVPLPEPTQEEMQAEKVRQLRELGYGPDGKPLSVSA